MAYIIGNAQAKIVVCDDDTQLRKYLQIADGESPIEHIVTMDDLGAIDEAGYISITGRKKDLIITAGGKNVAPAETEGCLQSIPVVGQAVVVGDRQPYLSALIVLDPEALPELEVAAQISGLTDVATAARNPEVQR